MEDTSGSESAPLASQVDGALAQYEKDKEQLKSALEAFNSYTFAVRGT